jgi:hypothetical protein
MLLQSCIRGLLLNGFRLTSTEPDIKIAFGLTSGIFGATPPVSTGARGKAKMAWSFGNIT